MVQIYRAMVTPGLVAQYRPNGIGRAFLAV